MGLSDNERLSKMMWAISSLTELGRDLKKIPFSDLPYYSKGSVATLLETLDKLWHAYLGCESNGAFWLLGGDHNNPVTKEGAPWSTAIIHQCETNQPPRDGRVTWSSLKEREFDPFDGFLNVEGLLPSEFQKLVYRIYGWSEQLSYALRRYKDALSARYEGLSKLISDIQGVCFDLFKGDTAFGKAYVANRLFEALYRDEHAKKVFKELHTHHDLGSRIRRSECSLSEVIAWDRWYLEHQKTTQNVLVLALRVSGPAFHYEHQLKKMISLTRGKSVRESVLRREFEKCVKLHREREAQAQKDYVRDYKTEAVVAIHGYDAYRLLEDKKEDPS